MIKVEHIETYGFEAAIRGMRNPMNSWEKSDSFDCGDINGYEECINYVHGNCPRCLKADSTYCIGTTDLDLMQRLFKAGTEHRKYLRQIIISMDLTAPLYWWKEFDTYKVGTVANSCSTMHKIAAKEFTFDDFSYEHLSPANMLILDIIIQTLNNFRQEYIAHRDKFYWWQMIQLLPSSYNQKRTITMNYENAVSMIAQRSGHKLDEWREFVETLKRLPYIAQIMGGCTAEK